MAQPAFKEGYEAGPLPAEDAALLPAAPVAAPASMPQEPPPRSWHGHLLNPFGKCDRESVLSCFITHYCPAVQFGLTARRAGFSTFLRAFFIFFALVVLSAFQRSLLVSGSACASALHLLRLTEKSDV